ncbi:hypothetical protein F8M49_17235 [Rhodococcus zopfii]|uniref:Uncharacterized protein n=1 Tax=Rhodococcus zopfii TaxID=43772 RepID=A0ABU3WRJ8_9NOCA|nr:hypothetical protein [Rhodococcus zopfii]
MTDYVEDLHTGKYWETVAVTAAPEGWRVQAISVNRYARKPHCAEAPVAAFLIQELRYTARLRDGTSNKPVLCDHPYETRTVAAVFDGVELKAVDAHGHDRLGVDDDTGWIEVVGPGEDFDPAWLDSAECRLAELKEEKVQKDGATS